MNEQQLQKLAIATTKALGYAENGGAPNPNNESAGKTGELKSIFQFEPATWKADAKEYLGNENAPITPDNETAVVLQVVSKELKDGKSVKQIASNWNSGDYDAYTGKFSTGKPSIGVNEKYGVKYNVPAYANSVQNYVNQFMQGTPQENTGATDTGGNSNPGIQKLMSIIQQSRQKTPAQSDQSGLMAQAASSMPQSQPSTGALGQAAQGMQS